VQDEEGNLAQNWLFQAQMDDGDCLVHAILHRCAFEKLDEAECYFKYFWINDIPMHTLLAPLQCKEEVYYEPEKMLQYRIPFVSMLGDTVYLEVEELEKHSEKTPFQLWLMSESRAKRDMDGWMHTQEYNLDWFAEWVQAVQDYILEEIA
jgi:hypothetical protein